MTDLAVPAALLAGQAVAALLGAGGRVPGHQILLGLLTLTLAASVLAWRRHSPVTVFAGVLLLDGAAEALLPEAAVAPAMPVAVWIALYSLSVRRESGPALLGAGLATAVVSAPLLRADSVWALLDDLLAGALLHLLIVVCGRLRRHRTARRTRIAARLADVERERRTAAAAERERLARELHDAAGHHLSAVAVHSAAAQRLAGTRPELAGEALAGAAESGRAVLAALGRLEAAGGTALRGPLHRRAAELCDGLARLGLPVTLAVHGRLAALPDDVAATAYRIVQESLTNAMRHAPGAPVTVRLDHGSAGLGLTVANSLPAPAGQRAAPARGSGRGIPGMRARAADIGGHLTAGPDEGTGDGPGGWSVCAALPARTKDRRIGAPDAVTAAASTALPLLLHPAPGLGVLLAAHALPLLWARQAPARALAAMLAVALTWSAATAAGLLDARWLGALAIGAAAELRAIHAVAAHGPARLTWPAPVAVGAVAGAALGLAVVADPTEPAGAGTVVLLAALGLAASPWLLPVWLLGLLARARRGEGGRWEQRTLDTVAARVGEAVAAERRRVAAGVRGTVAEHTARLVRCAESGVTGRDRAAAALAEVTGEARSALSALRDLLDVLDRTGSTASTASTGRTGAADRGGMAEASG